MNKLIGLVSSNPRLAAYISTITTTFQQLAPCYELNIPLSSIFPNIEELSPNSIVSLLLLINCVGTRQSHTILNNIAGSDLSNYA